MTLAFLLSFQAGQWFNQHYRIGFDAAEETCLPWRVYLVEIDPKRTHVYQRGDYVAFVSRNGLMGSRFEGQLIAKQVAGIPGDHILIRKDALFINDTALQSSMPLLPKLGLRSGQKDRNEIVPSGKLFVLGSLPRAFDSRYWGFLDGAYIVGPVTPIF